MKPQEPIDPANETAMPRKERFRHRKRRNIFIALGSVILLGSCYFLFKPRFNFYVGSVTIERVALNNEFDDTYSSTESKETFHNRETIYCSVWTSGTDAIIGTRWYYEDELILEFFERTQENHLTTALQPPLKTGTYRVDVSLSDGKPLYSLNFSVVEAQLNVIPPQPTPANHIDLENDPLLVSIPYAFDEKWTINGTDWEINEVKIVFLQDSVVVAVVVIVDLDVTALTGNQARSISKPIALYAWQNGYIDTARSLQIDGMQQEFENMFVTIFNPQTGAGTRIPYEFDELKNLSD